MERVEVTLNMVGLLRMQVCAVDDATDEEILEVCNRENPPTGDLSEARWQRVVRGGHPNDIDGDAPGPCEEYPGRTHFLVVW